MKNQIKFVLRRKQDGWYLSPGSHHTSMPDRAIHLDKEELSEWLSTWGNGYEAIPLDDAKEVIE